MIRPEGLRGAAFGTLAEGDGRSDDTARRAFSRVLGISEEWACVSQVHGVDIVEADGPGEWGEADGIVTSVERLPLAIGTADCVPVVLEGSNVAALVHAGWRGTAAGVIEAVLSALSAKGTPPTRAAIGPAIGACCYEVGPEVAQEFTGYIATTRWGTTSVDLVGAIAARLSPLPVWLSGRCTYTSNDLNSFRRDKTSRRQVALAWLPTISSA
jgi:YfiH family protein